jgi:hypothetical protein
LLALKNLRAILQGPTSKAQIAFLLEKLSQLRADTLEKIRAAVNENGSPIVKSKFSVLYNKIALKRASIASNHPVLMHHQSYFPQFHV